MELQVQELLERIKSEGVEAARAEANRIIGSAEEKAGRIVSEAERSAAELEASAKVRIEAMEKASRLALNQASRDTILALRGKVQLFMSNAILASTSEALSAEYLSKILPEILKEMVKDVSGDIQVLLPGKTIASLDSALANRLSLELGKGITFKPFEGLDAGFRIAVDGSSAHYDFSAEAVAQILASRVNARLGEYVKESLSEGKLS